MVISSLALGIGSTSGPTEAANIVCVGEAISGRAISHGGNGDSAVGPNGDNCFFSAESSIGQEIAKVCPIRDIGLSAVEGPTCRVEAIVRNGIIKRIMSVTILNKK